MSSITAAIRYMHLQEDATAVSKLLRAIVDPDTPAEKKAELRFRAALRLHRLEREVELVSETLGEPEEAADA
jgi:Arc/MetJ family transcription regulator